ncbi:MAG: dihydroorotase family protein [Candidatus Thermoplasmatota archaeon]|nr:dihydroorotase family protein [Candidatus Thermoplasmatota archaeon]
MMVIEGRAYYEGELQHLCLGVEGGVIKEIGKTLKGDERHDFGDMILLPGGIDVHVHFREPGLTHKEDFHTGTESAAVGGITSVLDMPNTLPPGDTADALLKKRERVSGKANVDFGLFAGVQSSGGLRDLEGYCHAFKVYMAESFGQPGIPADELPRLLQALKASARRLTVHAEDPARFRAVEEHGLRDHWSARPDQAEEAAIRRLAARENGQVHVAHLSSRLGLAALEGTRLSSEATPMHLLLTLDAPLGALGKVNPPLRTRVDTEAIWRAFSSGRIDVLASDHAPHTLEEKEEFSTAPPGAPNVETTYALMFRMVKRGKLSLKTLVSALCSRPAELFGLGSKGGIRVGGDADIVVFNPREVVKVRSEDLHYKCGWTPFEGWEAIFPKATFLRGVLVARERELERARKGRWLPFGEPQVP